MSEHTDQFQQFQALLKEGRAVRVRTLRHNDYEQLQDSLRRMEAFTEALKIAKTIAAPIPSYVQPQIERLQKKISFLEDELRRVG